MANTYSKVSGFPVNDELANSTPATSITSQSFTTGNLGDLVICMVHNGVYGTYSTIAYATGVTDSASAVTWQGSNTVEGQDTGYPEPVAGQAYEIWRGVVAKAGTSTTVTATFATGVTDLFLDIDSIRSSNGSAATWTSQTGESGFIAFDGNSTTVDFSSLTSGSGAGIYWGYSYGTIDATGPMTPGTTTGFGWYVTPTYGNIVTWNIGLAASTTYAPTCTQTYSGNGWYDSIAAIFVDTATSPPPPVGPAVASYTTTQMSSSQVSSYTRALTGVTAGDLIILQHVGTASTIKTVADNFANHYTWTKKESGGPSGSIEGEVWVGTPPLTSQPSGSVTVTVTLNAADYAGGELYDITGPFASTPIENAYIASGTTASASSGSRVPTTTGDLVMNFACATNTISSNPSSPWTVNNGPVYPPSSQYGGAAWQNGTGGTGITAAWTCSSGQWYVITLIVGAGSVNNISSVLGVVWASILSVAGVSQANIASISTVTV